MTKPAIVNSATISLILAGVGLYFTLPVQPKNPDTLLAAQQQGAAAAQAFFFFIGIVLAIVALRGVWMRSRSKLDLIPAVSGFVMNLAGLAISTLLIIR